jgi:hypothetical protein
MTPDIDVLWKLPFEEILYAFLVGALGAIVRAAAKSP